MQPNDWVRLSHVLEAAMETRRFIHNRRREDLKRAIAEKSEPKYSFLSFRPRPVRIFCSPVSRMVNGQLHQMISFHLFSAGLSQYFSYSILSSKNSRSNFFKTGA